MSAIQDYLDSLSKDEPKASVAGPKGLLPAWQENAQSDAMQSYMNGLGGSYARQGAQQMTGAPTPNFSHWYTGANTGGTANGWDTDFQNVFQTGIRSAQEKGDPYGYFAQPKATGVVTWDNARGQGDTKFTFGDVVVDGNKVANVYTDFDRHTANVMMGEYLIETGSKKGELNQAADINKAWDQELARLRTMANSAAEVAPRAKAFSEAVTKEVTTDADRLGIVAGGAAGAAVLGAGVGSVVPVIGTAVGALVFGVAGGIGAWLNSDSLAYQLARSQEQVKLASAESAAAGAQAWGSLIAQNVMSIGMSPFSNLMHGSYDLAVGQGVGKGAVGGAFEETNDVGARKAGGLVQALGFGTMIADSFLQFASPAGKLAYQAQMSVQIGAGVSGLLPGVGAWDQMTLKQNNIWTSEEINPTTGKVEQKFDVGNALAGIGNVGIDVVQLGAISSLSRGVDRLGSQVRAATGIEGGAAKTFRADRPWERLNLTGAQRAALKSGGRLETRSGYKFVVADDGKIVGKARGTLAMLAPSEGLQALSAKMLARRDVARRNGAVTAEELYRAASDLALGQRGLSAMLVNAVGEGQEEVIQGLLEPMSQDHKIDAESVMRAGLAGAAAGFGMTAGARLGRPSQDMAMYAAAMVGHAASTGGDVLTYKAWQGMDDLAKRTMVKSASGLSKALTDAAFAKIARDRVNGTIGNVVEAAALEDYRRDEQEAALATGAVATDQASPIVMHESASFRPEAFATSHGQLLTNQMDRTQGAVLQLDKLTTDVTKAQADTTTTPEVLAKLLSDQSALAGMIRASQTLERTLSASVKIIDDAYANEDTPAAEAEIDVLNDTLEAMFDMSDDTYDLVMEDGTLATVTLTDEMVFSFSKAVSRLMTRDPADSTGSWQLLVPQVNKTWAFRGADGLYGVSQVILQSIRGDYDGDKVRLLQQLILDDARFVNLRSGANILGADVMPDIGSSEFEALLSVRVMQSWNSRNVPLREAARRVAREIERSLFNRYDNRAAGRTLIPTSVIVEVSAAVQDALANGKDVRKTVLELMSRRAGSQLTQIGRGEHAGLGLPKLSNEMYWVAGEVTRHMQEFQSSWARYTPLKGDSVLMPKSATAPSPTSTEASSTRPLRGATEGSTMIEELPGTNLFRMFQKLHYTMWESTEKYAGWAIDGKLSEYQQLVQFYEALSQGVNKQRNERMSPSDQILGNVMDWLRQMAADPAELERLGMTVKGDMALIANAGMPQMVFAMDDSKNLQMKYTGKQVTIGQHLLYLALHKFEQENKNVWDKDVNLKAAYNNLLKLTRPQTQGDVNSFPGTAEMAFVTIFEGERNYDLIGADAVSLGVNRTVGQTYRQLMSDSPVERNEQKYALRAGAPYADSKKGTTIPFDPQEIGSGSVSAYKALVDSLFSAADSSISMNLTGNDIGKTTGRLAKKGHDRGEAIQKAYTAVHALLRALEPKSGPYTAADISRIANQNREFGDMLMKTIPPAAMPWTFKGYDEDGHVIFSSWFYEVWAQPSAKQAEMSYARNLITDSWYAKVRALDIDFAISDSGVEKKIAFHRLDSRIHRVMFNLASRSVADPTPLEAFMTKLNEAQSVEQFERYLNTSEYLGAEGAPMVVWVDDVAEFDPERAGGGWSTQLSTPSLMEHIENLRKTASRMVTDLDKAAERSTKDIQTALAIQRWYEHLKDPGNQNLLALSGPKDEAQYKRFVTLLEKSSKRRMANGPRAMLQHTAHLVYGLYGPAHAKGLHPPQMAANAALEAQDNAFGYLIQAERVLGDLTTHNEESVSQAPQMILRDGGRTMTRYGAEVDWDLNAVEAMLPLMLNKENHPLMRAVLFDTVVELDTDNVARRKFLMGSTLEDVMSNQTVKELFNDKKNPNLTQSMKFLVKMEQGLRDTQKHQIEQKVTEMVLAWTTALDQPASFEEIQSMTVKAYTVMASVLQVVGRTRKRPNQEDPAVLAGRVLKESSMVAAISAAYKVDVSIISDTMSKMKDLIQQYLIEPFDDKVTRIRQQAEDPSLSVTERDRYIALMQLEIGVRDAMQAKINRMFDLNVIEQIVAENFYSTEASEWEKDRRQSGLMTYVYEHGELMQAAGPAMLTVQAIMNHYGETAKGQKVDPLKLPDETWEELSNVIISMEIQHLLTVGPASKPPPPYPSALKPGTIGLDKRKFLDYSFSYLFDFLDVGATDGIVAAARQLAVEGGRVMANMDETDIIKKVSTTMLGEGMLGQWTPAIAIQSIESYELLMGASAIPSISMHGLLSRRWGATAKATRRQYTDTVADAVVTLTSEDLNWTESGMFHDVPVTAGNGVTRSRPMAMMNNRFAEELSFSYLDPSTGARVADIDLMRYPNVARQWAGAEGTSSRFKEVNILRLIEELERILKANHPGSSDDETQMLLRGISVTMKFVDPDAQPATGNLGAIHANSVWHEGAVYASDGDVGESLIDALFFGEGGLNPRGQQAGLDTRKLGLSGIEDYERPRFEDVRTMEADAGLDFARMLALKTNKLMDTAINDGKPIDIQFYNAAYKLMKLKHWVEGIDKTSGEKTRWSAEQVIEWQMAHSGVDFFVDDTAPLESAKLWIPSDQVLADMMGDIGYGGVSGRALKRGVTVDLDSIPMYTSVWTGEMERKFPIESNATARTLMDTDVARQSFVQDVKVSSFVTVQERTLFQRRVEAMNIRIAAAQEQRTQDAQSMSKTFKPMKNLEQNMRTALGFVSKRDIDVSFPPGFEFLQGDTGGLTNKARASLQAYTDWRRSQVGKNSTSFWIYQEGGMSSVGEGRLTKSDLGGRLKLVPGEVVLFDVASYRKMDPAEARAKALLSLEYFVNQGAALMIESSEGADGLIAELQYELQSEHGYQRYEGDSTILVPDVFDESSFQNVAASRSRLVAPSKVQIDRQSLTLLVLDQEVEENTMWVPVRPGRKTKFDSVQQVFDLLPTDVHSQFNTINTSDDAQMVMRWLEGLQGVGVEMLRQESLRHLFQIDSDGTVKTELKKGVTQEQVDTETHEFNESWDNLMKAMPARVAANTTLPLVGETNIGFIPLVNTATGELLLYRHGYSYPKRMDYQRQLRNQTKGDSGLRGIVTYSGERQPSATTHPSAIVVKIGPSPGRGLRMEMEIPVQELGSKIVYEHNGMKFLKTSVPANISIPENPVFGDIEIEGFASAHDVKSKEAFDGLLVSFQNAFTIFGVDFTQDIQDFFGTETADQAIRILRQIAALGGKQSVEQVYQYQSILAGQDAYISAIMGLLPTLQQSNIAIDGWAGKLQNTDAQAAIARAMIVYLMSPNADVNAILGSTGFYVDNPSLPGAVSQKMPELFTRAFDLAAPDSAIKVELARRFKKKLNPGYHLDVNSWELEVQVPDGRTMRGLLQYGEAHVSEDNPVLNLMAQERKDNQSATVHQGLMNMLGTGGVLRPSNAKAEKKLARLDAMLRQDLPEDKAGSLWRDLTFVDPQTYGPGSRWQTRTPAEHQFYKRSLSRMKLYRQRLDLESEALSKDPKVLNEIKEGIIRIVNRLQLHPSDDELVHYWIRQVLYHPAEGSDQDAFSGDLSPQDVLGATSTILDNIGLGYLPTYDGAGPSFFAYSDLQRLFQASQRNENGWRPLRKEGDPTSQAKRDDIGDWIAIAFGQAINEKVEFDPIYRLDFSGFMNTYQTVLRNSGYMMDITFDKELQGRLLDPKSNELLSVSFDPVEENRLQQQQIMAIANLEYEDLMSGATTADSVAWRSRRLAARARWRSRHKVRPVKVQSARDFGRNGTEVINRDADMHSLQRIVVALRHGTAMLNPGLYFSMIPEQGFRMMLSELTNALTGDSTMASVSGAQRGVERLASSITGGRANFEIAQYSPKQIKDLNELFKTMGNDGAFTSLIISDMMWKKNEASPGKVVDAFERYASLGNKWQDPTWGTTQRSLARHYIEAIIREIEAAPTRNVMTIDSVISNLRTDPAYFAKHHKEMHQRASNFVVDFRSLKNTPWSLAMKGMYEPWATSESGGKRFVGTLIKLQAMYATYNMNVLTTITGMQGYTAMAAAFVDGKQKPGSLMKLWFKARNGEPITDDDYTAFDMSTAIDGVTIANAFIRGGVTQTGLFMLGMAAGGVLSGEDDEAKRRRKLAQAQGSHLIMDPRRLETDFRNKDALFLDWMPPQMSAFFKVQGDDGSQGSRAVVQVSWIMKQFLSPILGMERFFMTGDFGYITAGFSDAVSSLPLFNKGRWDDAVRSAHELEAMAADEQAVGTPTATKNSMYLLTSAVGIYESMLVENMFVNSLYAGFDMYDRDPTRLVLRDSDGDIQKTIENDSRPNDLALTNYVDKYEGDVGQGYKKRDPLSANMAAYTENNFTAAAVLSLFKPIHHQEFLRGDMPERIRTIKMPELSDAEARVAVILAMKNSQKSQGTLERRLSLDEITAALKADILSRKDWDSYNNLDALAMKVYTSPQNPIDDPLSRIGPDGRETLTKSGHVALFKGLMGGTISLDDPEIRGISISVDMRKELEKDFFRDMTREGVDLGLTQSQAESRAKRLMLGPMDDPTIIGFKDILWDKRIPWTSDAKYKQLNTTYVQGPDGFPWATGFKRGGAPGMGGIWQTLGGVKKPTIGMTDAITQDGRMNSVDLVRGINTGLRGLVPLNETELIPTDWEQTQKIIEALRDSNASTPFKSYAPNSNGGRSGGGSFYRGSGGGGYSSKGYSPTIYWSRQPTLPRGANVYGNTTRNLFWNNANIRRTVIRRERYQSSRGRLMQWQ